MTDHVLTAEELLGGAAITQEITIPPEILAPAGNGSGELSQGGRVILRPLTVRDIQLISKATREDASLTAGLMVQQSLVEPKLTQSQIFAMHGGLMTFLVEQINAISGLKTGKQEISDAVQSPLVKACYILSKEFGWTPHEISEMTMGQILLYLETLNAQAHDDA
ncbi:hypothetical protein DENIS_2315 [Desulfonema ishimotonii]|uniref:Uncharacterized protein n=1 Tax=Desulfonema ishimotonii TaxID=45657 RepID=A0A401FWK9_9BACT|nr:hypothetical protein [Desulfonema ishimotonii]GBC61355.1 hypothetical protein DENIS_2315 [Desulfonema ishimotonii]